MDKGISKEKIEWLREIEVEEFEHPMKYITQFGLLYPEEFIKNTPLEQLKKGCERMKRCMKGRCQ